MRCSSRVDAAPGALYRYAGEYLKEMTDEISTSRLCRACHELWRRQCRNGNDAGACRQGQDRSQGALGEIDRMLQAGGCQGPAWQRAAEIPLRVQESQIIARANSSVMAGLVPAIHVFLSG